MCYTFVWLQKAFLIQKCLSSYKWLMFKLLVPRSRTSSSIYLCKMSWRLVFSSSVRKWSSIKTRQIKHADTHDAMSFNLLVDYLVDNMYMKCSLSWRACLKQLRISAKWTKALSNSRQLKCGKNVDLHLHRFDIVKTTCDEDDKEGITLRKAIKYTIQVTGQFSEKPGAWV